MNATQPPRQPILLSSRDGVSHAQVNTQQRTAHIRARLYATSVESQDIWPAAALNRAQSVCLNAQDKFRKTIGRTTPADKI